MIGGADIGRRRYPAGHSPVRPERILAARVGPKRLRPVDGTGHGDALARRSRKVELLLSMSQEADRCDGRPVWQAPGSAPR